MQYSVTCVAPVVRRFNPSFGPVRRVRLLVLFHNNSYARDDQGGNPGQVIEGSTVSSKICDRRRHHDS